MLAAGAQFFDGIGNQDINEEQHEHNI